MEQSSKNENKVSGNETCELFINEIIMEKQHAKESYHSLQITTRKNPRNEETMKINFQKFHAQEKLWKIHHKNSSSCIFYFVNDHKDVDVPNV